MTKNLQTSQNIVEASFKLMAEHGIEKMSLSMIAKEVGISKPAIYYHFSSKEALVDFLFEEIFLIIILQNTLMKSGIRKKTLQKS
ncbi:Transcriptional regulator, TetR [Bacillus cereus]|nr:Transcriptional regulator, TetR [Bacillus cereus]